MQGMWFFFVFVFIFSLLVVNTVRAHECLLYILENPSHLERGTSMCHLNADSLHYQRKILGVRYYCTVRIPKYFNKWSEKLIILIIGVFLFLDDISNIIKMKF